MSLIDELSAMPGVIAAGEYSYRGDRFSCQGQLDDEKARMAYAGRYDEGTWY